MKKRILKLISAILVAAVLLTGCSGYGDGLARLFAMLGIGGIVSSEKMTYTRPDLSAFQESVDRCCAMAGEGADVKKLMEEVWICFGLYHDFYTNYYLADIRYCQNITDIYWDEEYAYCLGSAAEVDAGLDRLLYALASSALKEELEAEEYFGPGYFDPYTGDSIWDAAFTQMSQEEAALLERYYDLCEEAAGAEYYSDAYFDTYAAPITELLAELVALRQDMAEYLGYADYPSFAYDYYYGRDYTPGEAEAYLERVAGQLAPLYETLSDDVWEAGSRLSSTGETYGFVRQLARNAGGTIGEAFSLMDSAKLYDIAPGQYKYDVSFEVYLPSYGEPFVFMNPTGGTMDRLTFAHEFGHFCNDYASGGSIAGIDVAEVFSQAMEFMSLCYTDSGTELTAMKMADSLCVYVEQAAYASFEHRLYRLSEAELTVEGIRQLYETVGQEFGFDSREWDSREYIGINHFFTNPMYVISYVVSNDAALQMYQLEQETPGAGLALLQEQLATEEITFLAFLSAAGLESPFAEGRLERVAQTMKAAGLSG